MSKLAFAFGAAVLALVPAAAASQPAQHHGSAGVTWRHQGSGFHHPGVHHSKVRHHSRLQVGALVHPFWFAPQFHVRNWHTYGLAQPLPDHRWIRYYDDAYMIDRGGRVRDRRHGLDWDGYGEPWGYEGGIPRYVGDGDFHPDERDYAWVEEYGPEGYGYAHSGAQCDAGPAQPCGAPAYGHYPAYYGHACGYCAPIVTIVETTTTPAATTRVVEEIVEERVVHVRRGKGKTRPVRRAPPSAPGERG